MNDLSGLLSVAGYALHAGFTLMVPLLLLGRFLFRRQLKLWDDLFLCANTLLQVSAVLLLINLLAALLVAAPWGANMQAYKWRVLGPYWWSYWIMMIAQLLPLAFFKKKHRRSYKMAILFWFLARLGYLFERLVIYVTSLYRDYLPSSWTYYTPHWQEYLFPFLLFTALMAAGYFLFVRKRAAAQHV